MEPSPQDPLFHKALGAVLGTTAGLTYIKPRSGRDALCRVAFSMSTGYAFYFVPIDYFKWADTPERWMAGACLVALAGWPVAGVVMKRIAALKKTAG